MLFNSIHYFAFAPVVIGIYFLVPKRFQRAWLLVTSLYFYAVFRVPFTVLLLFSIVATYLCTRGIASSERRIVRRLFLGLAIAANLSVLYFFKFIDFSIEVWNIVLFQDPCDSLYVGPTGVLLPMGISFFTLQAMAYAIDVYRGVIPVGRSLFNFALFLSFFPQLVAGPIMRAKDLLDQFAEDHRFRYENLYPGLRQIALGCFKKTLIADPAGVAVDAVFGAPGHYSSGALWIVLMLHAMQIYGDFSGYSDIAIGTGRIMGFHIPMNFKRPFMAPTMSEFWNRWHISLSTWLRDYIYIPLGGNRVSPVRTYWNIFITMAASGVWHGAGLNYVAWGIVHALVVVIERFIFSFPRAKAFWERAPAFFKFLYTYMFFSFTFCFFRARAVAGIGDAFDVSLYLSHRAIFWESGQSISVEPSVLFAIALLVGYELLQERWSEHLERIMRYRRLVYAICASILGYCAVVYSISDSAPFVYFQF